MPPHINIHLFFTQILSVNCTFCEYVYYHDITMQNFIVINGINNANHWLKCQTSDPILTAFCTNVLEKEINIFPYGSKSNFRDSTYIC